VQQKIRQIGTGTEVLKTMKELKPEHITVVRDTREQLPLDLAPLQMITGTLDTGDYSIRGLEHIISVERKSEDDLLACVGRERARFEREIMRLLAYPVRLLVVESTWAVLSGASGGQHCARARPWKFTRMGCAGFAHHHGRRSCTGRQIHSTDVIHCRAPALARSSEFFG